MQNPLGAGRFVVRVWNTAVFWTWMFNGLRFASGALLVPLLWRFFSAAELDMYSLFLVLSGFSLSLDHMFSTTVTRYVGYANQGVTKLQAVGVVPSEAAVPNPNTTLLGQLLGTSRRMYGTLSLGIFVLLGIGGTVLLFPNFALMRNPEQAWIAWGLTLVAASLELYTGYLIAFMRGLNRMVLTTRLSTAVYGLKLTLGVILLLAGFGLMAVPMASLVSSILQRWLARKFTRSSLPSGVVEDKSNWRSLYAVIWPNTWRLGLILLSINVLLAAFGKMITSIWGLGAFYPYYFSFQILFGICINMAAVWTYVKWPMVCQLRAVNDSGGVRKLIWPRLWLQFLTFGALAGAFIIFGPPVLEWISPEKQLLPRHWLLWMSLAALLEMNYSFWTTMISTENKIPSLWAAVLTNLGAIGVAYLLARYSNLGIGAFVLAPLLCGLAVNYWLWPKVGAESIGTTWFHFISRRPAAT